VLKFNLFKNNVLCRLLLFVELIAVKYWVQNKVVSVFQACCLINVPTHKQFRAVTNMHIGPILTVYLSTITTIDHTCVHYTLVSQM